MQLRKVDTLLSRQIYFNAGNNIYNVCVFIENVLVNLMFEDDAGSSFPTSEIDMWSQV